MNNLKYKVYILLFLLSIISCNSQKEVEEKQKIPNNAEISYVPEWAKEAIWYQIFVERFRNGDSSNDPTRDDIFGTYPDEIPKTWKTTAWGSDWYKADEYFHDSALPDKWNNLQLRRYGGDLQGVINKLDYLQLLGINAIYFNPLNDSPSLHKYDPRSWRHIDRNFGPDPENDKKIIANENPIKPETWQWTNADKLFLKVIKECHKRGIKIILDYSFNHTGSEFWAFKDVQKNGKNSQFVDWYNIKEFDNPKTEENEFSYGAWANVKYMPEIKKNILSNPNEIPYKGNIYSETAKQHIFAVLARWLDPNGDGNTDDGIDGYRLDVAAEIPLGFWIDFRKAVKKINPEAFLLAEIWWKSWPDEPMFPHNFLQGDMFDAIMNYRWFRTARHFFADAPEPVKVSRFVIDLKDKLRDIDENRLQAMMNLLDSHDSPRISTSIYNNGLYKYKAKPYENIDYKIDKPDKKAIKIQKMFLIHQFTFIGAPHIWYGDEIGMWGADDPDCRKPMVWEDIDYEDETHHPFDKVRKSDKIEQDTALLAFYKKLIQMRKTNPTLIYGNIMFPIIDDVNNVLVYSRKFESNIAYIVFNKSTESKIVEIPVGKNEIFYNALLRSEVYEVRNGYLTVSLNGTEAKVLICK